MLGRQEAGCMFAEGNVNPGYDASLAIEIKEASGNSGF